MRAKKVLLCVPWYSSLSFPLKKAFEAHGYKVYLFDYRTIEGNIKYNIFNLIRLTQVYTLTLLRSKKFSPKIFLNNLLIHTALECKPNLIFFVKGETISVSTLKKLKDFGFITMLWQVDSVLQKEIWEREKELSRSVDFYLTCEPGKAIEHVKQYGNKHVFYMLGASDKTSMTYSQHTQKKYDISFVGSYHPVREQYLKKLTHLDLHIWGWGPWDKSTLFSHYHKKALSPKQMFEIYKQSKIVINIGRVKESTIPTNLRPFEAAQVEAFILVEDKPNLKTVFKIGFEIETFKTPEELKRKVEYYLKHDDERKKMAKLLSKRVQEDHTYEKRLKEMFEYFKLDRM